MIIYPLWSLEMKPVVYYSSFKNGKRAPLEALTLVLKRCDAGIFNKNNLVALKMTFAEEGNTTHIRPRFIREVVTWIKDHGGKPFLTDSNTLYHGERTNGVDHLQCAIRNGFSYAVVEAPIIIADGLNSRDIVEIEAGPKHFKTIKCGSAIHYADALVVLSHVTGHLGTGLAGAVKNVGMGAASRSGKQRMHATVKPAFVSPDLCSGCGVCVTSCRWEAVRVAAGKADFDLARCVGCGECIVTCPEDALRILWSENPETLGEKIAEVCLAVMKPKKEKTLLINFLMDVTPDCDCLMAAGQPIIPNLGILASTDPVALDKASADLITASEGTQAAGLEGRKPGADKFKALRPQIDWFAQLAYGDKIGLGSLDYEMVEL
jgi:uncharacterized Fe-S center protein